MASDNMDDDGCDISCDSSEQLCRLPDNNRVKSMRDNALSWVEWSPFYALETGILTKAAFEEATSPATCRTNAAYERALKAAMKPPETSREDEDDDEDDDDGQIAAAVAGNARRKDGVMICDAWVLQKCRDCLPHSLVIDDVSDALLMALKSDKSDEELQSELLDIVGWDGNLFDFVGELLSVRAELKENESFEKKKQNEKKQMNHALAQQRRREIRAQKRKEVADAKNNYGLPIGDALSSLCNSLPSGSTRTDTKEYVEVNIPPPPQEAIRAAARKDVLVPISAFDEWAQPVFEGYKSLNRIQSRLFEAAYHGSGNLLICAPTGAGKTNIALMTILHELSKHVTILPADSETGTPQRGVLPRGTAADFKIVYVAPMKALAQEITRGFDQRLSPLGAVVRELTGDMQLTKKQIAETHILVTTPEKWDVVTRKSNDSSLAQTVRLLIIDEVHLLHEDRGSVLETLIARTLRLVEKTQLITRIVGLSATLPNYMDVGLFLHADPANGIFRFDETYRPVPLSMSFIGVKQTNPNLQRDEMNNICFEKVVQSLKQGNQVMVFVHSRRETVACAQRLISIARARHLEDLFKTSADDETKGKGKVVVGSKAYFDSLVSKSKNKELREVFTYGFAVHHAGMLRPDRSLVERLFTAGAARVLVCTATLAWGVNLPTHTVIIRGTDVYNAEKGGFMDLGMLDVMQIFGRAGRPQFDTSGEGIIITDNTSLPNYLSLLTHQTPIESRFIGRLADHLNAEIVLGTVTSVREGIQWLASTYLYIRMCKNPLVYGVSWEEFADDPTLELHRRELICAAARELDDARLIRYDEPSGNLAAVNSGRVASHFYIQYESMRAFGAMRPTMSMAELLQLVCRSNEFENLRYREEEAPELDKIYLEPHILHYDISGELEDAGVRVNLLFQAFLSHMRLETFTLIMDTMYIAQNITRIFRGLFEMARHKGWSTVSRRLLEFSKMAERQQWDTKHPLRQFARMPVFVAGKLEDKKVSIDSLRDMQANEISSLVGVPAAGREVLHFVEMFPCLDMSATIQPVTRSVVRVHLTIEAPFKWSEGIHGSAEPWWIWIEDTENEFIYHQEYFILTREQHARQYSEPITLVFNVPLFEPIPAQYYIRAVSDRWLGVESMTTLSFKRLVLPDDNPPHTQLLDLIPLPKSALHNPRAEALFRFSHFNPVQTQVFHTCYHTDYNVLLGAPTGSGKTVAAELAVLKLFRDSPEKKVVYIAPLKALVRERLADWGVRFGKMYGKRVVELTGDYTPNVEALQAADIVTTTPEKWDGITRNWKSRGYVKLVGLVVIDEIHMLGADRGPILEVIVSRMRYISQQTNQPIRLMGLSTAVANAQDLVEWLGVEPQGVFNFRPAVRPVPLEVHIEGFPGKHYCPRMASMNKPAYTAICTLSSNKPVIVFVSSRRQTRLTAIDLISYAASDDNGASYGPKWLHMSSDQLLAATDSVVDNTLRQMLPFGIGIHHAGLCDEDRAIVENLFRENKIQILVSTSTLAWGVNLPAHLVIVKGTEFYHPKLCKWVDMPVTDILQMMGRAGRPQFDNSGKAVILVEESKKPFYYKFLYEPFPVESSLAGVMHDHLNAEICGGTIRSKQDALDYLTWTYFFRRLMKNPSYYGLSSTEPDDVAKFLSTVIDDTIADLETCYCVSVDGESIEPLPLGRIASFYYLHFTTVALFRDELTNDCDPEKILSVLCDAAEYDDVPVRHNEEVLNARLAESVVDPLEDRSMDDSHTKTHLLFQAHMQRVKLPISDYVSDTKSVLDQALRICQAMIDVTSAEGWLTSCLNIIRLLQLITQAVWIGECPLLSLPGVTKSNVEDVSRSFASENASESLIKLIAMKPEEVRKRLTGGGHSVMSEVQARDFVRALSKLPQIDVSISQKKNEKKSAKDENPKVTFDVTLKHVGGPKPTPNLMAYMPRFPKVKQASWFVIVGCPASQTLLAIRRVTMSSPTARTSLTIPRDSLVEGQKLVLYICSDSYFGLDREIPISSH